MVQQTIALASGHEMPLVGFGLWKVPKESAADTVYNAIKAGYRLFDGAYDYQNEREAGEGIQRAISDGLVKRAQVFVTTKLWNNYHAKEHVLSVAKAQNDAWGLGYIDLFLMHFPVSLEYISPEKRPYPGWYMDDKGTVSLTRVPIRETWQAMEELVDGGIARSIGVSNCQAQTLYDMLSYARHAVSSLQIEHHPYLVQPQLVRMAQTNGLAVTAYSSFGPQSFLEMTAVFADRAKGIPLLLEAELIKDIAAKHKITPAQVLLRWATQRGIAVIPKSNNPTRLAQNLDSLEVSLTKAEIDSISAMDKGLRFNDPGVVVPEHPLYIFA